MINFRNDINGLRGIAVLAVVLFHFQIVGIQGGFVGVDIFFVISGFLMTTIIFNGLNKGNFSLANFYLNRCRRIIPALAFLCLTLLLYGWFFLLPTDYEKLGKHIASSLGFFSNIVYWSEAGYFDTSAYEKWLLHTWSLSVEWQFYIVYPIIVLLLQRLTGSFSLRWSLAILALLSFSFSLYASFYWPNSAFYFLPARAWEMLLGGLIYLFPLSLNDKQSFFLEYLGLGCILFSILIFSADTIWPGSLALMPVLGTILVIIANRNHSLITNNALFMGLGAISYSVYLWHWPIVVMLKTNEHLTPINSLLGILASFILGYFSYTLVEKNAAFKGSKSSLNYFSLLRPALALFVLIIASSAIFFFDGIHSNLRINMADKDIFIDQYKKLNANLAIPYRMECDFNNRDNQLKKKISPSCTSYEGKDNVFLWGDSTAQALSLGVRTLLSDKKVNQVATSACKPSIKTYITQENTNQYYCDISNQFALAKIKKLKPEIVIVSQLNEYEKTDWEAMSTYIHSLGVKHFILIGPGPGWPTPAKIAKSHWKELNAEGCFIEDNTSLSAQAFNDDKKFSSQYNSRNSIEYISLIQQLCQGKKCMTCVPKTTTLISVDGTKHLTPTGSIFVVKKLLGDKISTIMLHKNA